jgi:hypothetical protein
MMEDEFMEGYLNIHEHQILTLKLLKIMRGDVQYGMNASTYQQTCKFYNIMFMQLTILFTVMLLSSTYSQLTSYSNDGK